MIMGNRSIRWLGGYVIRGNSSIRWLGRCVKGATVVSGGAKGDRKLARSCFKVHTYLA